jgi:hypothetical protein
VLKHTRRSTLWLSHRNPSGGSGRGNWINPKPNALEIAKAAIPFMHFRDLRGKSFVPPSSFPFSQWLRAGARAGAHTSYADIAL